MVERNCARNRVHERLADNLVGLRELRANAVAVYLINAGGGAFIGSLIFTPLAVYYVTTVGLDPLQLVLVGTVLEGTIILFEVPTGVVADVYSRACRSYSAGCYSAWHLCSKARCRRSQPFWWPK